MEEMIIRPANLRHGASPINDLLGLQLQASRRESGALDQKSIIVFSLHFSSALSHSLARSLFGAREHTC